MPERETGPVQHMLWHKSTGECLYNSDPVLPESSPCIWARCVIILLL